ncbi:MAG: glycosyltransferase family 2 protein, partial [Campylobacterota bacterium]|nr:glycosyltransferase family 2 protein [Campylobacterota bacterium]
IVMPVYNVQVEWLKAAINSIESQWYKNWELCIADDKSTKEETLKFLKSLNNPKIKVIFLEKNRNISGASNEALKLATGEFVALMDNDDELTVDALFEVVKAINEKDAEFIYSDEDKLEMDKSFSEPHFKPDYAHDMLLSQNYISHLCIIKKELIERVGGWEEGVEGSQDYDLYLKVLEETQKVAHIDKVLYHWRKAPDSTATEFSKKSYAHSKGRVALQNALTRRGIKAKAVNGTYPGTYRVQYEILDSPLVSIIIPFKDKPELLDMCINSILEKSTYHHYEIIGISNNSEEKETFTMMNTLKAKDKRVSFYEYNVPFNYSRVNNHAVREYAKGEHILLLNNDIEIISPELIESMLEFSQQKEIACVGSKLYYPDDTIQHAGVILGIGGVAGHSHKYFDAKKPGYFSRLSIIQNLSAVTAACLMVKRSIYDELNGLDEENLSIAFNDVDFCLRALERGYRNLFTPYAKAYHHESISRGAEDNPQKVVRFNAEVTYMQKRHKKTLESGDRYYNKNLTLEFENFG